MLTAIEHKHITLNIHRHTHTSHNMESIHFENDCFRSLKKKIIIHFQSGIEKTLLRKKKHSNDFSQDL